MLSTGQLEHSKRYADPNLETVTQLFKTNINNQVIGSVEDFKKTEFKVEPIPDVGPLPEQS
jgi:hypothetical protein